MADHFRWLRYRKSFPFTSYVALPSAEQLYLATEGEAVAVGWGLDG